jgi:uncharacterized membrane protein
MGIHDFNFLNSSNFMDWFKQFFTFYYLYGVVVITKINAVLFYST